MKCRNCDNSTRHPSKYLTWREKQLCPMCAHELYPDKYKEPLPQQRHPAKYGVDTKGLVSGRFV